MAMVLRNPLEWLVDDRFEAAVDDLTTYMTNFTGRHFEPISALSREANRFEATDIVAVSCLAVDVPATVSSWLLLGEGGPRTAELLAEMDVERDGSLQLHDLASNGAAVALWELLIGQPGLGPTMVSKLMAAKRPALIPIFDTVVASALLPVGTADQWEWWGPWRDLLVGSEGEALHEAAEAVRRESHKRGAEVDHLSLLRILDIVIWRAQKRALHEPTG